MFILNNSALLRLASMLSFFLLWYLFSVLIDNTLLPGPFDVLKTIITEYKNSELFFHTFTTLKRVFLSFIIAMIIGTSLGILMGRKDKFNSFFDDWLILGLNIPALVIIILCYVWFGLNEVSAILAVSLNKIPMVAVITREGARSINKQYIDVAKFYNISKQKLLTKVIFPQLYPYLMSAARSGLSLIWKIVLVVELLGRSNGVGFKINEFFSMFDTTSILAYTLVFVLIIMSIEWFLVKPTEKRLTEWRL